MEKKIAIVLETIRKSGISLSIRQAEAIRNILTKKAAEEISVELLQPLYLFEGDYAKEEGFDFESAGLYGQDAETFVITEEEVEKFPNQYVHLYRNKGIFNGPAGGELINSSGETIPASLLEDPRFTNILRQI